MEVQILVSHEYRINDGNWMSAARSLYYLGALERFAWSIALDTDKIAKGNNTLEVREINDDGQSLQ